MPRNGFLHQELAEGHDDKELSYVQVSQGRGLGLCGFSYMWYALPKSLPQGVAGTSCGSSWIGSGARMGKCPWDLGGGPCSSDSNLLDWLPGQNFQIAVTVLWGSTGTTRWLFSNLAGQTEKRLRKKWQAEGVSKVDGKKMEEGRIWRLVRRREKMRK